MFAFIRLAGCSVGKRFPKEKYAPQPNTHDFAGLPIYTEMCTIYDGRTFACDTDYRSHKKMTVEEIIKAIPSSIEHICITGGEPFIHNLEPLVDGLLGSQLIDKVHIETSGTKSLSSAFPTY